MSLYSPFTVGAVSNFATGGINPDNTNLNSVSGIWTQLGFNTNPPYGTGYVGVLIWFFSSSFGRAVEVIIFLIGGILTLFFTLRDRNKKVSNVRTNAKLQHISDQISDVQTRLR